MEGGREDLLWKSKLAAESIVSLTLAYACLECFAQCSTQKAPGSDFSHLFASPKTINRSLEDGFALVLAQVCNVSDAAEKEDSFNQVLVPMIENVIKVLYILGIRERYVSLLEILSTCLPHLTGIQFKESFLSPPPAPFSGTTQDGFELPSRLGVSAAEGMAKGHIPIFGSQISNTSNDREERVIYLDTILNHVYHNKGIGFQNQGPTTSNFTSMLPAGAIHIHFAPILIRMVPSNELLLKLRI
ncbi:Armadillo-type fold [Senna tora]|uniref:Armadillo-type fold n=1 Tax=Senna tora TaxID=362788 RepID=A0A834W8S6_9FABA|nr:Armadillo-type fold [Senna tora]